MTAVISEAGLGGAAFLPSVWRPLQTPDVVSQTGSGQAVHTGANGLDTSGPILLLSLTEPAIYSVMINKGN